MNWFVYIIEADDQSYYTGISTDIEKRFKQHLDGKGAKFFNGRKPVKFVYIENEHTRSSASTREAEIKKLSRKQKEELINETVD
ncbi:MAG: GIY-YIG nuclease family protein [Gammaproteobacteria bacterium]|nr:MAG: GIY-YIG nuclease family protein [Gammaproteobacteria bacterium]